MSQFSKYSFKINVSGSRAEKPECAGKQWCILNLKFIFLPPPPLLDLYFFPK